MIIKFVKRFDMAFADVDVPQSVKDEYADVLATQDAVEVGHPEFDVVDAAIGDQFHRRLGVEHVLLLHAGAFLVIHAGRNRLLCQPATTGGWMACWHGR